MNYLEEVAAAIRREVDPRALPSEDTASLFRLYAVLALAKGTRVTIEDVHNAWVAWMSERQPDHESIKPYWDLDPDVQREDKPYVDAIRRIAAQAGR